ncbi:MAG: hypothetical protein RR710_06545 [Oscillospiraceae bacterium]
MTALLVKCKCHGIKIDRNTAFKVQVGKVNHYYCSEAEYNKIQMKQKVKDDTFAIIYDIFGYKVVNTALYSEMSAISETFGYETILAYLQDSRDLIDKSMSKDFQSEYGKIRYFLAILKNNLSDFKQLSKPVDISLQTENTEPTYRAKKRKNPLAYYEGGDNK